MEPDTWICSRQPPAGYKSGQSYCHFVCTLCMSLNFFFINTSFYTSVYMSIIYLSNSKKSLEKKEVLEEIVDIGSSSKVSWS